jgi:hypothetical protein
MATPTMIHSERRADQRPGTGDRGEVVAEHDPAVGRHEVAPVVEPHRRRRPRGVEREHARGDDPAVEAVGDRVGAQRRGEQPCRADALASQQREPGERASAEQ